MRKIEKGPEPAELARWKRKNHGKSYADLDADRQHGHTVRQAIRRQCLNEQYGLCAYCCSRIDENTSNNEHVEARQLAPKRSLDYSNLVASCLTRHQCNDSHGSQPLPLTPLMDECETELKFYFSGKVEGLTPRASQSVTVLGLGNQALKAKRQAMIDALLFDGYALESSDVSLLGDEMLHDLLQEVQTVRDSRLPPFGPVLENLLRQFLSLQGNES